MPWKETTMLDQKLAFINEWRAGNVDLSQLCKAFEISHPTAYKYIKRYQQEGIEGLFEKNRKPLTHPRKTPSHIEKAIVSHRKRHPRWGGKKLGNVTEVLIIRSQPSGRKFSKQQKRTWICGIAF